MSNLKYELTQADVQLLLLAFDALENIIADDNRFDSAIYDFKIKLGLETWMQDMDAADLYLEHFQLTETPEQNLEAGVSIKRMNDITDILLNLDYWDPNRLSYIAGETAAIPQTNWKTPGFNCEAYYKSKLEIPSTLRDAFDEDQEEDSGEKSQL